MNRFVGTGGYPARALGWYIYIFLNKIYNKNDNKRGRI
jgi:hypothetical protein